MITFLQKKILEQVVICLITILYFLLLSEVSFCTPKEALISEQ